MEERILVLKSLELMATACQMMFDVRVWYLCLVSPAYLLVGLSSSKIIHMAHCIKLRLLREDKRRFIRIGRDAKRREHRSWQELSKLVRARRSVFFAGEYHGTQLLFTTPVSTMKNQLLACYLLRRPLHS